MTGQIAVHGNSINDYERLVAFLIENGYRLSKPLATLSEDSHIVAVMVDRDNKTAHEASVTIMACYIACGKDVQSVKGFIMKEI